MSPPKTTACDIAICGAGPVGAAFALLLAEVWADCSRIALIDSRTAEQAAQDARMIAISQGSQTLLERVGAWNPHSATAIHHIHVSQRGRFGRTLIDRDDYAVPALGYVIRYGDLVAQLNAALLRRNFKLIRPVKVLSVTQQLDQVTVHLETPGHSAAAPQTESLTDALTACYAVHAEGGLFGTQQNKALHRDYTQTAITSFVTCALPQPATAFERFTTDGPIALLPAMQNQQAGVISGYALVWCCKPDDAARYMALGDADFLGALHQNFGDRLGRFLSVAQRSTYPLGLNASAATAKGREFAIGNAAQTLHPVAGQGFNLGLRDAYALVSALHEHFSAPESAVQQFSAARRLDRNATIRLTDWMPRLFASPLGPVIAARGTALALLDLLPPARHVLARQMMNGQR
jgi:2-octaprenyl-6-methoxyphenol hydroxylase